MGVRGGHRNGFAVTRAVAAALTAALLAAGCLGTIGDRYFPTYGNLGYEARHYDLAVTYDPATDRLQGIATITAKANARLPRFHLDFVGMTVHGVAVDGRPAPFTRDAHELVITPRQAIGDGRIFTVIVDYSGVPTQLPGGGFFHTDDGALAAGQPEVATTWYPVNDHPLDKATYTFRVTTPTGYQVIANGLPRAPRETRPGWTEQVWDARSPMASYLATIAIGEWDVRDRREGGLRIIDAVDPDIGDVADASLARQSEILDFLETQFARQYPFETAGAIVDDFGAGFALENQTRPIYDPRFFIFGLGDIVVVHELAHQWFGDDLALARWQDIWLNEGFATYAEWLWLEHEGAATAQELFFGNYQFTPPNSPFWQLKIGDPGPDALFAEPVYVRGAMALHALRLVVGDATFFEILHRWADRYAGGNVTTAQFVELAEHVSHRQLDAFFDEWLNTAGRPDLPEVAGLAAASADAQDAQVDAAADEVREWRRGLAERLVRGAR